MQLAARARGAKSGICMDVYTDCVGIQLYTGNFITPQTGKGGVQYDRRHAFCLETQYFPNAVNEKNFKSPVLKAIRTAQRQSIVSGWKNKNNESGMRESGFYHRKRW